MSDIKSTTERVTAGHKLCFFSIFMKTDRNLTHKDASGGKSIEVNTSKLCALKDILECDVKCPSVVDMDTVDVNVVKLNAFKLSFEVIFALIMSMI